MLVTCMLGFALNTGQISHPLLISFSTHLSRSSGLQDSRPGTLDFKTLHQAVTGTHPRLDIPG